MTDPNPNPENAPENGDKPSEETFKQADVDRIVAERLKREREATKAKYADYDALKAAAEGAKTAEDRIAELEQKIATSELTALRAKYAADVPERLRPLLTGTTEDDLKAQRDLIVEGENERKKNGNRAPQEGASPSSSAGDDDREFVKNLFGRAQMD